MKYSKKIIIFSFIAVITIIACKTKKETTTTPVTTTPVITNPTEAPKADVMPVTYETLKPLLAKSCNMGGCHDESRRRMNFKIYSNLVYFGSKGEIKTHVLDLKDMPPDEKLTDAELDQFRRWISEGMLEK